MPNCGIKRFVTQASFPGRDNPPSGDGDSFILLKTQARNAAMDLMYPQNVIDSIEEAKTLAELNRIMVTARHSDKRVFNLDRRKK